jgi:hypothetical protein
MTEASLPGCELFFFLEARIDSICCRKLTGQLDKSGHDQGKWNVPNPPTIVLANDAIGTVSVLDEGPNALANDHHPGGQVSLDVVESETWFSTFQSGASGSRLPSRSADQH